MKTCIDKVCEGVLCDDECKDLKPSICGKNRELFAPENACGSIRIEGADDVEINQGVCIDLTEGVHAYDGNGREIEYEVEPSEIGCCDVGEHEVTYTAIGSSKEIIPYIRTSKPMLGFNACGLVVKKVKRLVTILQALPPTIIGAVRTVLPIGASFDPMYGVSGIDDNGNATEVTFEGNYDVATDEADIVTFDSDVVQDLRSVKVSLEPIQNCTPWIGTEENNTPYLMRSVESIGMDVGNTQHDEIVGATVGWNQHIDTVDRVTSSTNASTKTADTTNNSFRLTGNSVPSGKYLYVQVSNTTPTANHIYLLGANITATTATPRIIWAKANNTDTETNATFTTNKRYEVVNKANASSGSFIFGVTYDAYGMPYDIAFKDLVEIDLTAMFGAVIADYVYSLERATAGSGIAWLKSYGFFTKDYYPYNVGELTSVKPSAHKVVGFNQWDEEWEKGDIDGVTGEAKTGNYLISKNFISVIPSTDYCISSTNEQGTSARRWVVYLYDENKKLISYVPSMPNLVQVFSVPADCRYIKFRNNKVITTYNNDICVNISDPNRNGEYEPYIEQSYPLDDSTEYRGLFKLDANNNLYADGDVYKSDGDVNRKYGIVDLGTLNWAAGNNYFEAIAIQDAVPLQSQWATQNGVCGIYGVQPMFYVINNDSGINKSIAWYSGTLRVRDTTYSTAEQFKAAVSGVYLVYELATPTTETAQPYESSQAIYEGGTEEYIDTRDVPIPVGHETSYALVCPIYGYDSVEVTRVGKNLFGGTVLRDGLLGIPNATDHASDGYVSYWANTQAEHNITDGMTFKENTQYTFIYKMYRGSATGSGLRLYYKDGTYVNMPSPSENYGTEQLIITSAEGKTVDRLAYYKDNGSVRIYYNESGIFEGDLELEDFEPYQADTYTSPLPQTVYGGTLDVVSGELKATHVVVDLGDFTWSGTAPNFYTTRLTPQYKWSRDNVMYCDKYAFDGYRSSSPWYGENGTIRYYYRAGTPLCELYVRDERFSSIAEMQAGVVGTKLCYELATPQTIQLTPQEVKSLIGENNVWSEDGKVQVVYSTPLEEGISQFNYEGVYPITYHTEDSCGNETDVTRYVIVGDNITPEDTYGIACQGKACYSIIECDENQ